MTLLEMLERDVEYFPEKTALIYNESGLTYTQLYERATALANFLLHMGLEKGQKVGLLLNKTPEVIISFLGVTTAGGVVFPIANNQMLHHIQALFDLTYPSALIVAESFQPLLSQLTLPCSDDKIIVIGRKEREVYHTWNDVLAGNNHGKADVSIQGNDIAYFNITSGTTGVPKCAITTHDNIYWNTLASVESLELTHEDVHLCMFPVFGHPHELFARALYLGGTIVLINNIKPKSIIKAIHDNNITCMMAIASIYETLVRMHDSEAFMLPSLRIPESGGMHVNSTLAQKFKERFKIPIITVWGSTETTGIALAAPANSEYRQGSMGKPCAYYEVKIVDEFGKELPPNEVGEMVIKGPAVCSGYFGNHEQTKESMKEGWFFTGDMVKRDRDDYYYFASRKTGMMKVAGMKVFPTEIEDVLSAHPKITEVAVVKGEDGSRGEVPKAVIVPKEHVKIDKREIRNYCEQRMAKYKVPRIIEFRANLPKSPGGKILWREL